MGALRTCLVLFALLLTFAAGARPMTVEQVPAPLKPWVPWVLHGQEEQTCPFLYSDPAQRRCAWPGRLVLELGPQGGSFSQSWSVAYESWVALPGSPRHWPQGVTVDGEPWLVTERDGRPALSLPAGDHVVAGAFQWEVTSEFLQVPPETGLVALSLDGTPVPFPNLDRSGRLWLAERAGASGRKGISNALELQVYRRIVDDIPLRIVTRLALKVAGEAREVVLGPALIPGYIPLILDSPLPARLEPDGRLRLQVRPGQWLVTLTARYPGPVDAIPAAEADAPWPEEEVWVFDARTHLRLVSVEGVEPIDPRQTSLPDDWRNLPAYRISRGQTLKLVEKRRGDPDPEPDRLSLQRDLWLDFDGKGYTVKDHITGTLTRGWRLEANPPLALGRVVVDGEPQFITRLPGSSREGVEVRRGTVDLVADSRLEASTRQLPAAGWDHDFQQLGAVLQLPPGWRLFAASGADRVQTTWLTRWSLLDLFIVLIITAAVGRLWGWPWGGLALVTLALVYHEPSAPRQVWLHILAAVALLRVLPPGRLRRVVTWYRGAALAALAIIVLPFLVDQVRVGLYPDLERPWQALGETLPAAQPVQQEARMEADEAESRRKSLAGRLESYGVTAPSSVLEKGAEPYRAARLEQFDPKANIQTGPGLPTWSWRTVRLLWNGPVESGQKLSLYLVPPGLTLVLRLLSVLLLAGLAVRVADLRYRPGKGLSLKAGGTTALAIFALTLVPAPDGARADMPSKELLDEMRSRLLEPPECAPACAQSPRMHLEVSGGDLRLRLDVHALANVAVPLPSHPDQWLPEQVMVDGEGAEGLVRDDAGRLWVHLGPGRHQVLLEGPLPHRQTVQLPLPLRPRFVSANVEGWSLEGLHENGLADAQLELTRLHEGDGPGEPQALEASVLPPFVTVERTLRLGLEWRVEGLVTRSSPVGTAVLLEVPLLEGESVTSAGVRVEHGKVLVNMAPGQRQLAWTSILDKRDTLRLQAPPMTSWAEVWRLDVSPIWRAEVEGIPVVHHQSQHRWLPEWRPWPGESVSVHITRPQGVEGRTLTIDASSLVLKPGRRATDAELDLTLRSSQGGQHTITLPDGARLRSVRIDGTPQPIRQEGHSVTLPVTPGRQQVALDWREPAGIDLRLQTPPVDLGTEGVNASVQVQMPRGRWVLLAGGPRVGPAVLFWGVLAVIVLAALALGRTRQTPLRVRHWLLLGLGLSQIPVWAALVVVAWLFGLSLRERAPDGLSKWGFNLMQIGLALLTLVALGLLFHAVEQGLLGAPEMQIAGNGSSAYALRWYQDRTGAMLPRAWVVSVPLYVYRVLMLAWALWLAFALIGWLRWGWSCYSRGGLWRSLDLVRRGRKSQGGAAQSKSGVPSP